MTWTGAGQAVVTLILAFAAIAGVGFVVGAAAVRVFGDALELRHEEEGAELEILKEAPLRIVTDDDFDDEAARMADEDRLAVQRRAEALNWFDEEEEKKSA